MTTQSTITTPVVLTGAPQIYTHGFNLIDFSAISGAGQLAKIGPGVLALYGASTYSGGTSVTGGKVGVYANTALGTGPVTLDGGTLLTSAFEPGLSEGSVATFNQLTLANPNTAITQEARMANLFVLPTTTTFIYTGQIFIPIDNAGGNKAAFGADIDDAEWLKIDGNVVMSGSASTAVSSGIVAIGTGPNGDGWHTFELRVSNNTGTGGAINSGIGWTNTYGFGYAYPTMTGGSWANITAGGVLVGSNYIKPINTDWSVASAFRIASGVTTTITANAVVLWRRRRHDRGDRQHSRDDFRRRFRGRHSYQDEHREPRPDGNRFVFRRHDSRGRRSLRKRPCLPRLAFRGHRELGRHAQSRRQSVGRFAVRRRQRDAQRLLAGCRHKQPVLDLRRVHLRRHRLGKSREVRHRHTDPYRHELLHRYDVRLRRLADRQRLDHQCRLRRHGRGARRLRNCRRRLKPGRQLGYFAVNPGVGSTDGTLTVGSFVLGTGTLFLNIDGTSTFDSVKVTGSTINLTGTNLTLAITPASINNNDQYNDPVEPRQPRHHGNLRGRPTTNSTITIGGKSFTISYHGGASTHDVVLTAQTNAVTIVNGYPALNANPHNLPQYAYIEHPGQHSMIESVVYSFSSSVSLSRTDFTITNKGPANIGGSNFAAYVPDLVVTGTDNNTLWTVTFANHVIGGVEQADGVSDTTGSIGDGKYELVLNAASGLNSTYDFYRLLGDVNHKGTVDGDNFQAFITAFNQTPGTALYVGAFDFDGGYLNPTVNGADFQTLVTNFNHTVGDITGFN